MSFVNPRELVRIIYELYDADFDLLLEAVIDEARQWADLKDWESNSSKWGVDENGRHAGSRDFTLDSSDLARTAVGGSSISKGQYVFLPMTFAMSPGEGEEAFKRMMYDIKAKGSVRVSTWPGYGVEGEGAYPAAVVAKLPAEARSMMQDQIGQGGIIYAVDGVPLSDYLVKSMALPGEEGDDEWSRFKKWVNPGGAEDAGPRGGKSDYIPPWLMKLSGEIEAAIKTGKVKAEIARIKGFEGELILSTLSGDAAMVVSKLYARAAYIFRKKMDINGASTDYDVAVSAKMSEFTKEFQRKPRGEKMRTDLTIDDIMVMKQRAKGALERSADQPAKRPPRFMLRDWIAETDNGYVLRRDVRAEDIRRLLEHGLNFEDGRALAESPMEAESSFAYNLDRVLSEDVIMESESTIQSFLDVMYSPWSMDERKLFGYLKTLPPNEVEDWVSALEIVIEQGEGDRWVHGLTERTLHELQLSQGARARVQGILIDLQASPVDDPMEGPSEPGGEEEMRDDRPSPEPQGEDQPDFDDEPSSQDKPPPPKKPDIDDDYNPESFYR
jgi:hypothetical protein